MSQICFDLKKHAGGIRTMKIAVAGTGYVGLSIATLLAQHNEVTAVDIVEEKVNLINRKSLRSGMSILRIIWQTGR